MKSDTKTIIRTELEKKKNQKLLCPRRSKQARLIYLYQFCKVKGMNHWKNSQVNNDG